MEKILERFSLGQFLSIVAPGVVALLAILRRSGLESSSILGQNLASSAPVAGVFMVILSYGIGLLLLECVNAGTRLYFHLYFRRVAETPVRRLPWLRRTVLEPITFAIAALFFWVPLPRTRRAFLEAQMMMSEFNQLASNTFELSRISSPFAILDLFRQLISRRNMENAEVVLCSIAEVHAKVLFILSTSLVSTVLAVIVSMDCLVALAATRHLPKDFFSGLAIGVLSYTLRIVASRYWEVEIALVSSLAEWRRR